MVGLGCHAELSTDADVSLPFMVCAAVPLSCAKDRLGSAAIVALASQSPRMMLSSVWSMVA